MTEGCGKLIRCFRINKPLKDTLVKVYCEDKELCKECLDEMDGAEDSGTYGGEY